MVEILTIPYVHFQDWDILQLFLERRKNPPYKISGDLNLFDSPIESLGNLESVDGNLNLYYSQIESLGNLKSVRGHLVLQGSTIKTLGNLESVGGFLSLNNSSIESLGNLKSVDGDLDLRWTPISKKYTKYKIRSMVNVGGNVYL
jgi:hypothetical protein